MQLDDFFRAGEHTLIVPPSAGLQAAVQAMEASTEPRTGLPATPEELAAARVWIDAMMRVGSDAALAASGCTTGTRVIEAAGHQIPLTLIEPPGEVRGAMLHIHGGGWFSGSSGSAGTLAPQAAALGLVVASVDYRLAPEHPYPAAQDDCEAAALWWIEHCTRHYGIDRIMVGGESAGGHLAAATAIRMRRRHGYRFAGAKLTFGLYDFRNGLPSRTVADGRRLMHDSDSCRYYASVYIPDADRRGDPDVSPLAYGLDELGDLPPALFVVGTLDPLLDDSILMHHYWRLAGNTSYLALYQGAPHGFALLQTEEGGHEARLYTAFLRACLNGQI